MFSFMLERWVSLVMFTCIFGVCKNVYFTTWFQIRISSSTLEDLMRIWEDHSSILDGEESWKIV